jgi:rhodanese-related sulfurtransferase
MTTSSDQKVRRHFFGFKGPFGLYIGKSLNPCHMDISVLDLKQKMERGENFVLIDVREPYEHEEFNVGGNLIPLGMVTAALEGLESHKNDEIVVYCRSGARSGQAQAFLQQAGFTNVRNLTGGMLAWMNQFG